MEEIEMKRKKIKLLAGVMIIAMIGGVFVGCGNNSASNEGKVTITVSGSTSVGPLMEKIAEKYEEEKFERAVYDARALDTIIENVNDISLLGSAIYSRWRYFNHWAYDAADILSMPNRSWFIIALNRLAELCKDEQEK